MQMTLGECISRSTELAGANLSFSTSDVSFWVNVAIDNVMDSQTYRRGSGSLQPPEMLHETSTTSGSRYLGLPSDFKFATSVFLTMPSGSTSSSAFSAIVPLRARDAAWMDSQVDRDYPGVPDVYASYGTRLELYPSPNSGYSVTVRYQARSPVLTSATSNLPIEDRFHLGVLYKTVELLHTARLDPGNAAIAQSRYLGYMMSVPSDDAWRQRDKRGMGVRFARSW